MIVDGYESVDGSIWVNQVISVQHFVSISLILAKFREMGIPRVVRRPYVVAKPWNGNYFFMCERPNVSPLFNVINLYRESPPCYWAAEISK